jgi:hypothetical protein
MNRNENKPVTLWQGIKQRGEGIGLVFIAIGMLLLIIEYLLNFDTNFTLLGISVGLLSVGLGFISVGIATKSDERYSEILAKINTKVSKIIEHFDTSDTIEPSSLPTPENVVIQLPITDASMQTYSSEVKILSSEESKIKTQARLDADKKKVGYTRGELFQKEDGNWAIHWGGKYPL